jgi:hypothetical protein
MDRAEFVANELLVGKMSCQTCPDLSELVRRVKSNELDKSEFVDIIRTHLDYKNNKVDEII